VGAPRPSFIICKCGRSACEYCTKVHKENLAKHPHCHEHCTCIGNTKCRGCKVMLDMATHCRYHEGRANCLYCFDCCEKLREARNAKHIRAPSHSELKEMRAMKPICARREPHLVAMRVDPHVLPTPPAMLIVPRPVAIVVRRPVMGFMMI
jgi:hypothetical protein